MSRDRFLDFAVAVLTICALVTTGLVVRREFFTHQAPSRQNSFTPTKVHDWRVFGQYGNRMGVQSAPVTVVVFSDFQCRFCSQMMSELREVRHRYGSKVSVVYRHYPLATHRYSVAAARASECAAAQGRFEPFHDALFAARDSIGLLSWSEFAVRAGVPDLTGFRACADGLAPVPALSRDSADAHRLGVRVTPTLLINGQKFEGALPMDTLETIIKQAIRVQDSTVSNVSLTPYR